MFSALGDTVLDPFVGSGTTLKACRIADRKGIGIELNTKYETLIKKNALTEIAKLETFKEYGDITTY